MHLIVSLLSAESFEKMHKLFDVLAIVSTGFYKAFSFASLNGLKQEFFLGDRECIKRSLDVTYRIVVDENDDVAMGFEQSCQAIV